MKRDIGALAARALDVLVVGGGIHGAACARDAAQRGLSVALVERADFGSGTSWNSLKTIHGGLRYLQKLDLRRMRASIAERRTLLRIAPELVRPLAFVVPTYGHGAVGREALGVALRLNDLIGFDRNRDLPASQHLPPGRLLSRDELHALVPGLPLDGVSGGALYHDAQVSSSERLLLAFLHAACAQGALALNYCEMVAATRDDTGRVTSVRLRDHVANDDFEARPRVVLNCTGPDLGKVGGQALSSPPDVPLLRAHNLVLGRPVVGPHALGVRCGGRFLFAVPWNGVAMLGTAYEPAERRIRVRAPAEFLDECAHAFPWLDLRAEDVRRVHSGLVPGVVGASGLLTRTWLRDHARDASAGFISVLGVKYTTARGVAQRAVDLVFRSLGRASPPCRTAETPLEMARPLAGPLEDAVRVAVRDEQALHLSDVILRRADLGTAGPPEPGVVTRVAAVMAEELRWDAARVDAEQRAYEADDARARLPA